LTRPATADGSKIAGALQLRRLEQIRHVVVVRREEHFGPGRAVRLFGSAQNVGRDERPRRLFQQIFFVQRFIFSVGGNVEA
jgi:hypothetical protein